MIYSRIKYGLAVYGQAGSTRLNKIQFLQNQLLKVLLCKKFRYSTDTLHNELEILKVQDMINQEILTFVFKYHANILPPVFDNYYETLASTHGLNTRHGGNLRKARHYTKMGASSIKVYGTELWNKLEKNLKSISNVKSFRIMYKKSIIPYKTTYLLKDSELCSTL